MLIVDSVDFSYDEIQVLRKASLEVGEGELVAVLGANGAGKTTLMKAISGLLRPQSGSVAFDGRPIVGAPPHEICRRGLLHVPEGRKLFAKMTVRENLELGAVPGEPRRRARETLAEVFERFPVLRERAKQTAGTLSGGEQQQLAIARALMGRPRLLLLDEPTLGLSPVLSASILKIISELHSAGTTILVVSQEVVAALKIADRAYILENGSVSLEGRSAELMDDDRVRSAYMGL